jgi:hypothetical protein
VSALSYLASLSSEAIPTEAEKQSIATSISTLNNRLVAEFGDFIIQLFRFGSSTRGTMLTRSVDDRSDIDYMVVFRDTDKSTQTYLDRLKRFAESRYSTSSIKQRSPTIVLELNHIKFDLVPAIPNFFGYQIPAPYGSNLTWIQTNPIGFNDTLTRKNIEHSSLIKPVIRLAKTWNALEGRIFDSYLLEQTIVDTSYYFSERNIKSYFFQAMLSLSLPWDASQHRKERLQRAKDIIRCSADLESEGYTDAAEYEIGKLY